MAHKLITDEMVERANAAWEKSLLEHREMLPGGNLRAAVEAIADDLIEAATTKMTREAGFKYDSPNEMHVEMLTVMRCAEFLRSLKSQGK